jgi:hypothetical protein
MPETEQGSPSTEAMAFSMVLRELRAVQDEMRDVKEALRKMIAIETKMVGLLETRDAAPRVPVAGYAQLYPTHMPAPDVPAEHDEDEAPVEALPPSRRRQGLFPKRPGV